jgi:hypothetical protein
VNPDKNEKIDHKVPESCPKCGGETFYRLGHEGPHHCYYCDPPPIVRKMQEQSGSK